MNPQLKTLVKKVIFAPIFMISISAFAQGKIKKAVFIIADGIPADVIERLKHAKPEINCPTGAIYKGLCRR